ncbi:hypothetical protein MBAV_005505 [Candidatus Magnetobacterium bavaricum]|uniref:Uncharacterized protein n=1 Tax=Candidatus Magnetobacterium bavaricum TaxID=29290 RepID=A0A0F3GNR0_9BACT|nr:hypothetical protein MBAV_005505 [Candidatus Magnetobacterium bavaricum]
MHSSQEKKKERTRPVKALTTGYNESNQEIKTEVNQEEVIFVCNSEKSAERVGRAMSHLIELCGGKTDPF